MSSRRRKKRRTSGRSPERKAAEPPKTGSNSEEITVPKPLTGDDPSELPTGWTDTSIGGSRDEEVRSLPPEVDARSESEPEVEPKAGSEQETGSESSSEPESGESALMSKAGPTSKEDLTSKARPESTAAQLPVSGDGSARESESGTSTTETVADDAGTVGQARVDSMATPGSSSVQEPRSALESDMQAELDTRDDDQRSEDQEGGEDSSLPVPEETFGTWLMTSREQRNLSLDDVAHITKIRKAILEALERGALDELPERVFVTGYVRSYASAVGLDVAEAVRRFDATYPDDAADEAADGEAAAQGFGWIGPLIAALLALLAAWFIITKL